MDNKREIAISLKNVSKTYTVSENNSDTIRDNVFNLFKSRKKRSILAVDSVSVDIYNGEIFGIIGRNGSGKSTLLKMIMKSIKPDKGGTIITNGNMIKLSLAMGFDPVLSARDNIYVNGSVLGLTMKQIGSKFDEILKFADLEKFVDTKIKYYSSGMRSRLAFAIAVHANADIFLFDEFFGGVGDLSFKAKSDKVFQTRFINNKTVVIVSHSMAVILKHCTRVLCLDKGKFVGVGKPQEMVEKYKAIAKKGK